VPAAALRPTLVARLAETPFTFLLVAANVAVLAAVARAGSPADPDLLVRFGASERGHLWAGEWWRLLAAVFLHFGTAHLVWNALAGIVAGRPVERAMGPYRFLATYLASGVGGFALSALGQDYVSAGASGALNGIIGAALVLHGRALGSWRAFARSPATLFLGGTLAGWAALAFALRLPVDHLAHLGGLAWGAALAAALAAPPARRRAAIATVAAALVALAAAAVWPRHEVTRYEARAREIAVHQALQRGDRDEARRLLGEAADRGQRSANLEYYRGLLRVQEGDLEGALEILLPVVDRVPEPFRDDARAAAASVARNLGYRYYTGEGIEQDALRGVAYLQQACALGDGESCRNAAAILGRPAP
jgi:rhomboid protease GluP